jgi:vesicle-fusing ATPase
MFHPVLVSSVKWHPVTWRATSARPYLRVHIEIGLPDEVGRLQILKIHSSKMSQNEFLGGDVDVGDMVGRCRLTHESHVEGAWNQAL